MLFSRYASAALSVFEMPLDEGIELIQEAQKQQQEERIFQRWLIGYEREIGFDAFKEKLFAAANQYEDSRTELEILEHVKGILEMRK